MICGVSCAMCSLHNHYLQLTMPHCHNHHSEVKGLQQLMCHVEHHAEHYAWQCAQLNLGKPTANNSAVICRTCNNMLSTPKCLGKGSDTKGSTITSKGPTPTITSKGLTLISTVVVAEILRNGRAWLLIIILIWSFLLEALCNCVLNALIFPHQSHPDVF